MLARDGSSYGPEMTGNTLPDEQAAGFAEAGEAGVLIVDDNPEDLDVMQTALGPGGYDISVAQSGREALKRISSGNCHVLVLDLRLPDGSGLDVLRAARLQDPNTVGIIMTAFDSRRAAFEAMRDGAFDFLLKPCPMDQLQASVARAVRQYFLFDRLARQTAEIRRLETELKSGAEAAVRRIEHLHGELRGYVTQLEEASSRHQRVLFNAVHEIRSPLMVVTGYAGYLIEDSERRGFGADVVEKLLAMDRNAKHVLGLCEDLMDADAMERGRLRLVPEELSIPELLREAAADFEPLARGRELTLVVDCTQAPEARAIADPRRARQALGNLVSNALKFTPRGGTVALGARVEPPWVRLTVSDTGKGIPPEHLEKVFQKYVQLGDEISGASGLGIGLAIVRELVELHGGRAWAESDGRSGSKFHFTLRLA